MDIRIIDGHIELNEERVAKLLIPDYKIPDLMEAIDSLERENDAYGLGYHEGVKMGLIKEIHG